MAAVRGTRRRVGRRTRGFGRRSARTGGTHEDGRDFVWFVSQHDEQLTAEPLVTTGTLVSLDGGKLAKVKLPPYGVLVAELTA